MYTILFLALVAVLLFIPLIREIVRVLTINKLRRGKDRSAKHICDLLCERFPASTVYRDVYLLKDDATEEGLNNVCDVVYISRGGVLLLTVLPDLGVYDNPKIGPWRYRYVNTKKETVTIQMANPFENMAFFSSVVEKLLVNENVLNASVSRGVVFSADLVDYTRDYPECLTIGTLFEYIEAFDRRAHFNKKEYRQVCEAIAACSEYLEGTSQNGFAPIEKIRIPKAARTVPEIVGGEPAYAPFSPTPSSVRTVTLAPEEKEGASRPVPDFGADFDGGNSAGSAPEATQDSENAAEPANGPADEYPS